MNVERVAPLRAPDHQALNQARTGKDESFGDVLNGMLADVNEAQHESDRLVEALAKGEPTDVHDVMIAMTEADLSFRLLLEVRNRLIDAYQEIQRMPV